MEGLDALYERMKAKRRAISPHMDYLRSLAEASKVAVEFGARAGGSTVALNYACETHSYDIQRRAVDEPFWREIERLRGGAWHFVVQSSLQAEIPECDLLLHDSLHNYDHLTAELERHHGKVRRWIVMHDTEHFGEFGQSPKGGAAPDHMQRGMKQAIQDFLDSHSEWSPDRHVAFSNGLTTLERQ